MIVFMAGYPYAGKSVVARNIVEQLPYAANIIDPKSYRDDKYDQMSEEDKRIQNLSVWEVSLDLLNETIKSTPDNEITVYDTACANYEKMIPSYNAARRSGHHIVYLFVYAPLETCRARAGDAWLSDDVIDKYRRNFEANVPKFKQAAHKDFVLNNGVDGDPDVSEPVDYIIKHYG